MSDEKSLATSSCLFIQSFPKKKRNLALCVIFSIITFGIYGIYWFVKINNDANELANPPKRTSGGVAFLLTLITCGIYGIYWAYKMGKQLDSALEQRGMPAKNGAVLYLILSVVGLGFVAWILMQNTINSMISD